MIEVKAKKSQAQANDPAERYVLKNTEERSKSPAAFTILLLGLALYLKSVFPSWTKIEEGQSTIEDEPEGQAAPGMADALSLKPPMPDTIHTGSVAADEPVGSHGPLADWIPPTRLPIDTPGFGYLQPEISLDWNDLKRPSPDPRAANDNAGSGSGGNLSPDAGGPDVDQTDPVGPGDKAPGDTDPGDNEPCSESLDEDTCDEDDDPQSGNRSPRVTGPVYLMDVTGCALLGIGLSDLLRNAVDPDGDTLTVTNLTVSSGALTQSAQGWVFKGEPSMLGPVTITYEITDGQFAVIQTAHFSVIRSSIEGTDGGDILIGTMCADDIDGGDGDDNIDGRAGDDVIAGGYGDDHIVAGAGNDTVFGGERDDIVFGGAGNDYISGGAGHDRLFGGEGHDIIFGDAGNDYLAGGGGDDLLAGGTGQDILEGNAGDDTADGGQGNDELHGGAGDDVLIDGAGKDTVYGGDGNDHLIAAADGDDDVLDGGAGCDTLDYSSARMPEPTRSQALKTWSPAVEMMKLLAMMGTTPSLDMAETT
ncbi:calcium-binding protein [Rhizobium sp. Root482]|uniref:calcium-binding protein n=1 Tax=Rhizobium sp. Root482 TaxID=1736543 RepID=UPI0009E9DCC8|nr:cadherin-like domain-containing protein [Rhizobium sp. Root482]